MCLLNDSFAARQTLQKLCPSDSDVVKVCGDHPDSFASSYVENLEAMPDRPTAHRRGLPIDRGNVRLTCAIRCALRLKCSCAQWKDGESQTSAQLRVLADTDRCHQAMELALPPPQGAGREVA